VVGIRGKAKAYAKEAERRVSLGFGRLTITHRYKCPLGFFVTPDAIGNRRSVVRERRGRNRTTHLPAGYRTCRSLHFLRIERLT
jgi:hypothetical protein